MQKVQSISNKPSLTSSSSLKSLFSYSVNNRPLHLNGFAWLTCCMTYGWKGSKLGTLQPRLSAIWDSLMWKVVTTAHVPASKEMASRFGFSSPFVELTIFGCWLWKTITYSMFLMSVTTAKAKVRTIRSFKHFRVATILKKLKTCTISIITIISSGNRESFPVPDDNIL